MRDRPITGLIKSIFRLKYPDRADAFDRLIDRLLRDGKRRDGIAHAWWLKGNRPGSIHAGIARPANVFGLDEYDYTAPELRALANRIEAKLIELIRFMKPYWVFVV